MKISAVVLTRNEEKNIKNCLLGLKFCDEILVIDDQSTDKTRAIAQKLGAKVFTRSLNNDFSKQRNFGLEKAKGDWVLFVDADERLTEALTSEIESRLGEVGPALARVNRSKHRPFPSGSDLNYQGFYLKRQDLIFGKWLKYGETRRVRLLRLGRKEAGKWERAVHEVWKIKGKKGELKNPLQHFPHPTIRRFLEDINFYTSVNAKVFFQQGTKSGYLQIFFYPLGKFLMNYFLKLGFLDGMAGFLIALFMSFHSFLTRTKLYFLWRK